MLNQQHAVFQCKGFFEGLLFTLFEKRTDIDTRGVRQVQKKTIQEVKDLLQAGKLDECKLASLRQDPRKGIQKLVDLYDKQEKKQQMLYREFQDKWLFDKQFCDEQELIAGVDEAGRGPLAGPVVAAAVILPKDCRQLIGLRDSKQLSEQKRKEFYDRIIQEAIAYHIAVMDADKIDRVNIYEATKMAMKEALIQLSPSPDVALVDAVHITDVPFRTEAIIKADDKSLSVAAASVLAKVTRDEWMKRYDKQYPMYGFLNHKGYGTKEHIRALKHYGPSPCHRMSFSPVHTFHKKKGG